MVKEIKEDEFKEVIENNKKVVIDCFATWCGPCQMLSPIVDQLSEEISNTNFYKLDVDNCASIPMEYGIMSIPTLLVFEDKKLKQTVVGLRSKEELEQLLR